MIDIKPRYWVDWAVPMPYGVPLYVCDREVLLLYYVTWLSWHLAWTDIPLPDNQRSLVEGVKTYEDALGVATDIASSLNFDWMHVEKCEEAAERHLTAEQFRKEEEAEFDGLSAEDLDSFRVSQCLEDASMEELREEFVTRFEEYEQIRTEILQREESGCPGEPQHADIPYRAVFAHLYKKVGFDLRQFQELLLHFYKVYNEDLGN